MTEEIDLMIIRLILIGVIICGCSVASTTKFGHWVDRGSNTFPAIYQCVEAFKPYINKECQ